MIYLEIGFWLLVGLLLVASHMAAFYHGRVSVFRDQYARHDAASPLSNSQSNQGETK